MAAGQGFKTFTTGEVLTAGDVNGYLMQGINVFTNATARDAAITAPAEGQFAFTKDNNSLWYYDGAAWVASGATGDIEGVTAGVGISGGGTSGTVTVTNSMATAIDAKGDLVPGTGADTFARLAVGANNTVLTADSTTATGLKWATPSGGGLSLSQVASGTASGSSLSITGLSSYDQIDFYITGVTQSNNENFLFTINSNTGSNYAQVVMIQKASTTDYTFGTSGTSFLLTPNDAKGATQGNQALYVRLTNCKSSGFTSVEYIHYFRDSAGGGYINIQNGTYKVAEAVSSFQFTPASGTISGGSYVVWAG